MEFKLIDQDLYAATKDNSIVAWIKWSETIQAWHFLAVLGQEFNYNQMAQILNFMGTLSY